MMGMSMRVSLWLVPEGADVLEGDRVVELGSTNNAGPISMR